MPLDTERQGGFTLIEILISTVMIVVSVLVYVSCVLSAHRMNRASAERALAVETLGRFAERLRADLDWPGLYARLRPLSAESVGDVSLTRVGSDTNLTTYPAASYYSDFAAPAALGAVTFLVQVPSTTVSGVSALRENASAPRYGLPHDLNGDGVIDANARDGDYAALPVVVRLRWRQAAQPPGEVVLATWLRGER